MIDYIRSELIRKHGIADNPEKLEEYLSFISNYKLDELDNIEYSETHHILTRSQFPEHINCDWNKILLKYEDHIKAHRLLYESFNLRTYQWCLNFMKKIDKDSEKISKAAVKGWVSLKDNEIRYANWKIKRKEYLDNMPDSHKASISKGGKKAWENYSEEEYRNRCEINKNIWSEEVRKKKSVWQSEYAKNNREKLRNIAQKTWDSFSIEKRIKFREKMNSVNNNIEKRLEAGKSIKKRWEDSEFKEKMKHRKSPGFHYRCIFPDGVEKIFKSLDDLKANGLNVYLLRPYLDTNMPIPIPKKQANSEMNMKTIGCKIYKIKK